MVRNNQYLTQRGAVFAAPLRAFFLVCLTALVTPTAQAKGIYQTGPDFVTEVYGDLSPERKTLWLTEEVRERATEILGHAPRGLRVRYHEYENRTTWILEEIGKELPITIGIVIDDNKIQQVKILAFRESRGGEVRYPAYTAQYKGASLTEKHRLSKSIDGITGATLSVRAVNKVTALALYYHSQVTFPDSQ